jgi:hypothetical protein
LGKCTALGYAVCIGKERGRQEKEVNNIEQKKDKAKISYYFT